MKIRIIICFSIFFSISGCSTYKEHNNYRKRIEYTQDWENIKRVYAKHEDFCFAADSVPVNVRFPEDKLSDRCFTSDEVEFIQLHVIENNSEFKFSPPYDLEWSGIDTIKNFYRQPCYGLYYYGFHAEVIYHKYLVIKANWFFDYQTPVVKLPDTIVVWQKYTQPSTREKGDSDIGFSLLGDRYSDLTTPPLSVYPISNYSQYLDYEKN